MPSEEQQDLLWIRAILGGQNSERACEEIHARYRLKVESFFATKGFARSEIPDLAQEVFLRVFRSLSTFRGGASSFRSWLFAVASRVASDQRKYWHRGKRQGNSTSLEEQALAAIGISVRTPEPGPHDVLWARERDARLHAAIERLPEQQRQCIRLQLKGYPLRQIATLLGIEEGTVKATLHQARKSLATQLGTEL